MAFLIIWSRPSIMVYIVSPTVAIKYVNVGLGLTGVRFGRATFSLCIHALLGRLMLVDIGDFSKFGGFPGLVSWIYPWHFALLVCVGDFLIRLPCPFWGRGVLLHLCSRLSWDLDLCGGGLEGFLVGRKLGCMWVLYRQLELVQLTFHLNYFGLFYGCSFRILSDGLHNWFAVISFHGIEHATLSLFWIGGPFPFSEHELIFSNEERA